MSPAVDYPLTALISDLHGNLPALERALADARERGVRRYVCLGDVIGYGASPRQVLEWVMALCVAEPRDPGAVPGAPELLPGLCLRGNHEQALLLSAEDFNPRARAAIEWTRAELSRGEREHSLAQWDFLDALEPERCDERAHFAHASPRDPLREYLLPRDAGDHAKMAECFAALQRAVCFVGHSHVPAIFFEGGRLLRPRDDPGPHDLRLGSGPRCIVNVGSVGQPRDGDPRLSYALFDGRAVTFVRLEYDVRAAADAIRAVPGLPDFLADRLALGR